MSELILFQTGADKVEMQLNAKDGSVWLTHGETTEVTGEPVVKESLATADGKLHPTQLHRLEMIVLFSNCVKGARSRRLRSRRRVRGDDK